MKINIIRTSKPEMESAQVRREVSRTIYLDPYVNVGSTEWDRKVKTILDEIDDIENQSSTTTTVRADLEYVINGIVYYHIGTISFIDEIQDKHDFDRALYVKMCNTYFSGDQTYKPRHHSKHKRARKSLRAWKLC